MDREHSRRSRRRSATTSPRRPTPAPRRRQTSGDTSSCCRLTSTTRRSRSGRRSRGNPVGRASRRRQRLRQRSRLAAGPGPWDAACGFPTAPRRPVRGGEEDRRARQLLGAAVVQPFVATSSERTSTTRPLGGSGGRGRSGGDGADAGISSRRPITFGSRACCSPGRPRRPRRTRRAAVRDVAADRKGREQLRASPHRRGYGTLLDHLPDARGPTPAGTSIPPALERVGALAGSRPDVAEDRWLKQRAIRAYRSQVEGFGPLVISRMVAYEVGWGGEAIAWLPSS